MAKSLYSTMTTSTTTTNGQLQQSAVVLEWELEELSSVKRLREVLSCRPSEWGGFDQLVISFGKDSYWGSKHTVKKYIFTTANPIAIKRAIEAPKVI